MAQQLFRKEALEAQAERLHGEIILAQPLSMRLLTLFLFLVFGAAIFALVQGEYARTETVPGWLVPSAGLVKLVPARSGVVEQLYVEPGSFVEAGAPIATVNSDPASGDGQGAIDRALTALEGQSIQISEEIDLARTRAEQRIRAALADLESLEEQKAALSREVILQDEITASARAGYEAVVGLLEKGLISRAESERRRQAFLSAEQQREALARSITDLAGQMERARLAPSEYRTERDTAVARLEGTLASLDRQKELLIGGQSYQITAPVAGRVTALALNSGTAVDPSRPVATILPSGSVLEAQLFVPSRAAGFVEEGQQVKLAYEAFPRNRFGQFKAEILRISGTIQSPTDVDVPLILKEPFYQVQVVLEEQAITAYGQSYPLQPGMMLSGSIVLETRSFLDWLLDPLRSIAGRENAT